MTESRLLLLTQKKSTKYFKWSNGLGETLNEKSLIWNENYNRTLNKIIKLWSAINAFYCMLISMSNI